MPRLWICIGSILLCLSKRSTTDRSSNQKKAMEAWVESLIPEKDLNESYWPEKFRSKSPALYFDYYIQRLTNIFASYHADVNFALVGACDGTADKTVKRFLAYKNWKGVFVEPMSNNIVDLQEFIATNGVSDRALVIRAAATSECPSPTLMVERPLYEEKQTMTNKTIPHWLRRQIGSVLPSHRSHARPDWTLEEVRCVTAADILSDWADFESGALLTVNQTNRGRRRKRKRRPHVLKIDVEGHDFEVLMSFLLEETPVYEQPLMIEFEAKSIAKKFPIVKAHMEKKGYVVSKFGADGFAMLKGDRILEGFLAAASSRRQQRQQHRQQKDKEIEEVGKQMLKQEAQKSRKNKKNSLSSL